MAVAEEASTATRLRIGVAGPGQRAAVEALRRTAFRQATEFRWRDESMLGWSAADDAGAVLMLREEDSGSLLSSVRASLFTDLAATEAMLEYALDGMGLRAPLLVASRACTLPSVARRGLLMHLRRAYVGTALALPEVQFAITLVYDGAPRLRSMREAGFEFHVPVRGWDSEAHALTQPLMAVLPRARFARAIEVMTGMIGDDAEAAAADAARIAELLSTRRRAA